MQNTRLFCEIMREIPVPSLQISAVVGSFFTLRKVFNYGYDYDDFNDNREIFKCILNGLIFSGNNVKIYALWINTIL